jgi:hypothetical protein
VLSMKDNKTKKVDCNTSSGLAQEEVETDN